LHKRTVSRAILEKWQKIIGVYSGKALTYETDKLVAVSGLVSYMQPLVGVEHQYAAWLLMWYAIGPEMPPTEMYIAPNWS
jgi:hypothetical protein